MCDANDENHERIVLNFVQDTIVSGAKAAQPSQAALQSGSQVWVFRKLVNGSYKPPLIPATNSFQFFRRTTFNPNRECHAEPYPNPKPDRLGRGAGR